VLTLSTTTSSAALRHATPARLSNAMTCVQRTQCVQRVPSHLPSLPVVCDPQTYLALDGRHASDGDYLDGGAERPVTSAGSSASGRHVELWRASCPRRHCVRHARVTLFRCKSTRCTLYARGMGDLPPRRLELTAAATLADVKSPTVRRTALSALSRGRFPRNCTPPPSCDGHLEVCACLRAATHFLPAAGCPVASHPQAGCTVPPIPSCSAEEDRVFEDALAEYHHLGDERWAKARTSAAVGVYSWHGFIRSTTTTTPVSSAA
jgi:hypothetical protein